MKKVTLIVIITSLVSTFSFSQVNRPETIKKKTLPAKLAPVGTPPPSSSKDTSVYSLTAARITIKTGNDNKEYPSKAFIYISENKSIWGEGAELFTQRDQGASVNELKVNTAAEFTMQKSANTNASAYTLSNLQNKGLKFSIYYLPNFFADAWKIETVTLTLEFKDQYGRLHPTFGSRIIQYNIANGLLTNTNPVMTGTTDSFFTPMLVSIVKATGL